MKRFRRDALILPATAVSVLLADQLSKRFVAAWLGEGMSRDLAPWLTPIFRITHVTNTGSAFGLFRGWGDFFVVVAVIVILTIIVYHRQLPAGAWLPRVALGLQLGGAAGNMVDRLRQGFVVDFIDLNFWPLREWPVSNLADISIVTGVIVLALLMVQEEWLTRKKEQAAQDG